MLTPVLLLVTGKMQNNSISGSPLGILQKKKEKKSRPFDYYKESSLVFFIPLTVAAQGSDSKCNYSRSLAVQRESIHDTAINRVI